MTTPQHPIPSGFDATTTAWQALDGTDLSGKTAIVTGGGAGLNRETARVLSAAGATVIVPARDVDKASAALAGLPRIEVVKMDLMQPDAIDAFAEGFLASGRPLHILVNGAGIMATPFTRDSRGNEAQFSANHLGHFQLTARLYPALRQAQGARVVSVSSRAHRFCGVNFEDPNFERRAYDRWQAYGQSKTANVLFAVGLDRLGENDGIRAFSLHPGMILTGLARHMTNEELGAIGGLDEHGNPSATATGKFKSVEQGAATIVWCAASPQLQGMGGVYCDDVDIAKVTDDTGPDNGVRQWAIDPRLAERLWQLSESLTGVSFSTQK